MSEESTGKSGAADGLRLSWREMLLVFAFWTFMAALTSANRMFDVRGEAFRQPLSAAPTILAFAEYYLWALLTLPIFAMAARFSAYPQPRARSASRAPRPMLTRALVFIGVGIVLALFVTLLTQALGAVILPPRPPGRGPRGGFWEMARFRLLNELVIYIAVLAAGVARAYSVRYRARQEHAVRLEAERAALQAQLADARLEALRMQLDPHFLFNTLHAVSSLVERDPKGVRRMISRLSELLRHSIEGSAEQETALRDELDLLRRYIDIMEIRFQGRLEVRNDVDDDTLDALVPNLILQPLVENAIKHGVSKVEGMGRITLSARRDGGDLVLRIWNNGPPPDAVTGSSDRGIGVRNTMERLSRLYGSEQRFTLQPNADGGTLVEIRLPYHRRDEIRLAALPVSTSR